jgi:hypothetical protein
MKSILWIKKFGPLYIYYIVTQKVTYDEAVTVPKNICYFQYFWKVSNKSQGYFCWKCKKRSRTNPPYSTVPVIYSTVNTKEACTCCLVRSFLCYLDLWNYFPDSIANLNTIFNLLIVFSLIWLWVIIFLQHRIYGPELRDREPPIGGWRRFITKKYIATHQSVINHDSE